ncbi:GAF sensor signal transduction histidine kinase [Pseudoalteromonas luteoviolacea B = ATCC 29581]|nr:GAF sensor signal transduction histidine kinase [Pseudoalteromonas luteoviolacea B = ATCC 29581]
MNSNLEKLLFKLSTSNAIDSGDLAQASQAILKAASQGLQVSRVSMWSLQSDHINCELLVDHGEAKFDVDLQLFRKDFPNYFEAIDSEQALIAEDATIHPATSEFTDCYLNPLSIRSMLDLPIRHLGKMIGVICCEHQGDQNKAWTDDEVAFVLTLAEMYGRAFNAKSRCEYESRLEALNANLEAVVEERTHELEQSLHALKASQESLIESEKFTAFGELMQGISHELNTPLGVVITSISHAIEELQRTTDLLTKGTLTKNALDAYFSEQEQTLQLAGKNVTKASRLLESFKQVSMISNSDLAQAFNVESFIRQIIETLEPIAKKQDVRINLACDSGIEITSLQGLVAQVLIQLAQNALAHAFELPGGQHRIDIEVKHKNNVLQIVFSDNGRGIEKSLHKKVFDPFYTTTRKDGSSGMGLSLVSNIVHHKLGGRIKLENAESRGCRFVITLPNSCSVA